MNDATLLALALPIAWLLDTAFGEPRNALHPVAWLGRLLAPPGRALCGLAPVPAFVGGAAVWLVLAAGLGAGAWWLQTQLASLPLWIGLPALAVLIKPTFAWRMLRDEVSAVESALTFDLDAARTRLARIVSRDVRAMEADAVRETAIETLAENLNDSVVAPLFWFALLGLPGAVIYRLANTMDAMWGYRSRWEWAGKWAARADDVLSWLPARLTASLLWPGPAWRALRAEAARTPSPNGGWPMGAMALRLGVRLRKPGAYALNAGCRSPEAADVQRALASASRAASAAMVLATLAWAGRALA